MTEEERRIYEQCRNVSPFRDKPLTNFDRITQNPEALAEFISNAMYIFDTERHILTLEALKIALKTERQIGIIGFNEIMEWLKQESEEWVGKTIDRHTSN